jgi:integrase/recombinase XerC
VALTTDSLKPSPSGTVAQVIGKGQKTRDVPLGRRALAYLAQWYDIRDAKETQLFYDVWADKYAGPLTVRMVQAAVEKARRRAHLPHITAHTLRHYYATTLIRNGANVFAVQRLLGHSSVSTTQTYVSLDTRDLSEAARLAP